MEFLKIILQKRSYAAQAAAQQKSNASPAPAEVVTTVLPNKLVVTSLENSAPIARVSVLFRLVHFNAVLVWDRCFVIDNNCNNNNFLLGLELVTRRQITSALRTFFELQLDLAPRIPLSSESLGTSSKSEAT